MGGARLTCSWPACSGPCQSGPPAPATCSALREFGQRHAKTSATNIHYKHSRWQYLLSKRTTGPRYLRSLSLAALLNGVTSNGGPRGDDRTRRLASLRASEVQQVAGIPPLLSAAPPRSRRCRPARAPLLCIQNSVASIADYVLGSQIPAAA